MSATSLSRDLSIIITCYNEKHLLAPGIARLRELFALTRLDYEIVLVDDCSTDGSREFMQTLREGDDRMVVCFHEENRGRGAAVATGVKVSSGYVVGFNDLDFSTDPVYIIKLFMEIRQGMDIATAARVYKLNWKSINVLHRYILHKGYRFLIKAIFRTPLTDTETGCKFFRRTSLLMYIDEIEDKRWFWDTEVMLRGFYHGLRITEVPTLFIRQPQTGSTVKVARDVRRYLAGIWRFYKSTRKFIISP